jgi:flagellin
MTVINTNVKALYTQSALKNSNRASEIAMQQLSTGKRINSSKDDAAGLAIAARMTQNIQGLNQSIRNAGDAISMIQTAEGATQEITTMLQRMSELAVQSSNSTYSADQRSYLDQEFQQLKQEIIRVSEMHEWNGFPILNGKAGLPVGAPKVETVDRAAVSAATAGGKVLKDGDLKMLIGTNEYVIPASAAADDTKSSLVAASSSAAGSAIAIAAAINNKLPQTGVSATANGAEIAGAKTTVSANSIQTDLYINGFKVNLSLTSGQTESQRRAYVMNSINAQTAQHGVIAGDPGNGGLKLTTTDGRNLSVWYDASVAVGSDFGLGMNTATTSDPEGVTGLASASVAAISNKVLTGATTTNASATVTVSSTSGLVPGMNVTGAGIPAGATIASINSGTTFTLSTNATGASSELSFTGGVKASTVYGTVTLNSDKEFTLNPGANAYPTEITASTGNQFTFPTIATYPAGKDYSFSFNGKTGAFKSGADKDATAANFAAALNTLAGAKIAYLTGETVSKPAAGANGATTLTMTAADIAGLVPGMALKAAGGIAAGTTIASISGTTVTLSQATTTAVTAIEAAVAPAAAGSVYIAHAPSSSITITTPDKDQKPTSSLVTTIANTTGFSNTAQVVAKDPTYSNLSSLGFVPGAVMAKNIGRLNFQVGPAANQLISIDLADFGKNGDITGPITSDKAPTNLLTVQSANDVIMNVNKSLDRIAATRATMGAVMNRLTHVIDNLTNVVMNSESSRSQIEDADYAKASTELARTQIMQQAATAVLAQANTSQQTVLKLLQG